MTRPLRSRTDVASEAAALGPWFHNLHLPGGVQTAPEHPLGDFPLSKWRLIASHLPDSLDGWTVLDIGCNAGFHAIELARHGAHVVGLEPEAFYLRQARWAMETLELTDKIELRQQTVYELARSYERFDLILFMGVFYHLRHPLLALEIVAAHLARLMIFQTLTMPGEEEFSDTHNRGNYCDSNIGDREVLHEQGWPKMAFIEHRFAGDHSNWWIPNHAGVKAMLRSSGLHVIKRPAPETYMCVPVLEHGVRAGRHDAERIAAERAVAAVRR